jgi:hypothetical protein
MLTDFQNSFTTVIRTKFAIKLIYRFKPQLKRVAALPWENLKFKIARNRKE